MLPVTLWGLDRRVVLLIAGIMGVSVAYVLLLAVAATITVQVQGDLASHWQTSYDLLVRAPGHRLPEEARWEMARINYLANISPSITTAQYQAIREIPGVAVAAPVSMVGYFYDRASHYWDRPPPGLYRLDWQSQLDTGLQVLSRADSRYVWTYNPRESPAISQTMMVGAPPFMVVEPASPLYDSPLYVKLTFPVLLAGIDPAAESALVGLDRAIVEGEMLTADWPYCRYPPLGKEDTKADLPPGSDRAPVFLIPVLARSHLPQVLEAELTVASVTLPTDRDLMTGVAEEGRPFLDSLTATEVAAFHLDLDTAYRERLLYWRQEGSQVRRWVAQGSCRPQLPAGASREMVQAMEREPHPWGIGAPLWPLPSPVQYRRGTLADSLAAIPAVVPANQGVLNPFDEQPYRAPAEEIVARVSPLIVGVFDESHLRVLAQALTQVPLETYYQVQATARYDGRGHRLSQPLSLSPGMTPLGYLQSPPAMLTTLEAACAILGEPCISAIRVRVAGCEEFTSQSQARLEAVAAEIVRRTGLEVDIVTGSSPGPVLVLMPEGGQEPAVYVEELWVQKNVHLNIERRVQRGNHLLLALILLMTVIYTYNASEMWIWQRSTKWAVMRAVGWRGSTLMAYLLRLGMVVGGLAGGMGLLVGWGIKLALGLQVPGTTVAWIVPLSVTLLLTGMLFPAWRMGRMPLSDLLQGRTAYHLHRRPLVWILARHRQQAIAGLAVVSGASLLLTVVLGGLLGTRGYLQLTLLGQYLLVRLQSYHWLIVALAGCLSGLAVLDVGLLAVQRNRAMVGVFRAVGWRTQHILIFWVRQGAALGLLGGAVGSMAAVALLITGAGQWEAGYGLAALVSIVLCTVLSAMASLWPAYVAVRYPVVEVLKDA